MKNLFNNMSKVASEKSLVTEFYFNIDDLYVYAYTYYLSVWCNVVNSNLKFFKKLEWGMRVALKEYFLGGGCVVKFPFVGIRVLY